MEEDERDLEQTPQNNNANRLAQNASNKANKKALQAGKNLILSAKK